MRTLLPISLKGKMTLAMSLLVITLLAIFSGIALKFLEDNLSSAIGRHQFAMVASLAREIDDKIILLQNELTAVASTVPPELFAGTELSRAQAQAFLNGRPDTLSMFDNGVGLFTTAGRLLAINPQQRDIMDRDFSTREYISQVVATGRPYISQPLSAWQQHGHPILMFTAPVLGKDGRLLGILGGSLDLLKSNFIGHLAKTRLGEGGYLYLYNADRTMIVHPDQSRILKKDVPPGVNVLFDKAIDGFEGSGQTVNSRGLHAFSSFRRLATTGWILAANFPVAEALAPVSEARRYILLLLLPTLLAAIVLVRILMGYLTAPLHAFTRHVEQIRGSEDVVPPVAVVSQDEIGKLGEAFNVMAGALNGQRVQLREQFLFLQTLLEALPTPVFYKDVDGAYLGCNRAFVEQTGKPCEQVAGKCVEDVMPPELAAAGRLADERLLRQGPGSTHTYDVVQSDDGGGSRHWVVRKAVFARTDDTAGGVVGVMQDVTERKRAEESEHRTRLFYEALAEAILHFLNQGSLSDMTNFMIERCLAITGARCGFLYELDTKGGARFLAVAGSLGEELDSMPLCRAVLDGIKSEGYYTCPRSNDFLFAPVIEKRAVLINDAQDLQTRTPGDEPFCSMTSFLGTPLYNGDEVVGAIGLLNRPDGFSERDQQEVEIIAQTASLALRSARLEIARKSADERLRQAQKMEAIGQLAGGIAHDFNNLLTVINGYGAMLVEALEKGSVLHSDAEAIVASGERAAALTGQLLAFSRQQVLSVQSLDLNALIVNLDKILARLIREDITINLSLDASPGIIKADSGQVEQIIMNLVVNARDAMPQGGRVTIETSNVLRQGPFPDSFPGDARQRDYVSFTVRDTGHGMVEEVLDRAFEPFFTTKEQGQGTGLGLSTVYGIVKQSDGFANVESAPGMGTSVTVLLPCGEAIAPSVSVTATTEVAPGSGLILLVEDEQEVLSLLSMILQYAGYQVLEAMRPSAALELFQQNRDRIDLMVTDMVMPEMHGNKLAERLREEKPGLRVIYISGYNNEAVNNPDLFAKGDAFLQKPFLPATLVQQVGDILGRQD